MLRGGGHIGNVEPAHRPKLIRRRASAYKDRLSVGNGRPSGRRFASRRILELVKLYRGTGSRVSDAEDRPVRRLTSTTPPYIKAGFLQSTITIFAL
jgi:hypothetical protein